jgi:hypothetical protein
MEAITLEFFLSKTSTNCSAQEILESIISSQKRIKKGSFQINGFALKIASQSHLGYGCLK